MALKFPDILEHNNSNLPLADITEIRGNSYPIANISATGSIPINKRKVGAIVFASGSQEYYGYYGVTATSIDWDNPSNWKPLAASSGSYEGEFSGSFIGNLNGTASFALTASYIETYESITYNQLMTYISSSLLIPGKVYEINDYQTIHLITTTTVINTGPIEPLLTIATDVNSVSNIVYSKQNPFDIIHWDIYNNIAEDNITFRPGKITYREQTKNKVIAHYDWRAVKHRRYAVNAASYTTWDSTTSYTQGAVVLDASNNLWVSNISNNLNNTPSTTANSFWTLIWDNVVSGEFRYFLALNTNLNFVSFNVIPNVSDFIDVYTFHDLSTNNSILDANLGCITIQTMANGASIVYNNIVFYQNTAGSNISDISFDLGCHNMTFCKRASNQFLGFMNFMATNFNIFFRSGGYYNIFYPGTSTVILGSDSRVSNIMGSSIIVGDNIIGTHINRQVQEIRVLAGYTTFMGFNIRCFIGIGNIQNVVNNMRDLRILGNSFIRLHNFGPVRLNNQSAAGNYDLRTCLADIYSDRIHLRIPITFNGNAGSGAVGTLTIDRMAVPLGFSIQEVFIRTTNLVYGTGATLNFGWTNQNTAIVDNTTGQLSSATDSFIIRPSNIITSNSGNNIIVGAVTGAAITSGTAIVNIYLVRRDAS